MARKLPRDVHNALAEAQLDLEWAVRMFHESVAPHSVDVPLLVKSIETAFVAGQQAATAKTGENA